MAMIWAGTDLQATYKFYLSLDGFDLQAPEVRHEFMVIPGIDGVRDFNLEFGMRIITVRGMIIGSSNADMYANLVDLEGGLFGSLAASGSGTFVSPARALNTMIIEDIDNKKFQNCRVIGWKVLRYFGPRVTAKILELELKIAQVRPFTNTITP
jgi:hypothetical protein